MPDTPATDTPDFFDRDYTVPELKPGDTLGSYRVAEASASAITLQTNYGMLLILLVAGVAMAIFDVLLFSDRVLSHVLLAWSSTTALAFKGAMIVLPLFGLPWALYSLGRRLHIDVASGTLQRQWLFAFGSTAPLASLTRIELVLEPPVTDRSDVNTRLVLHDARDQALLELPSAYGERDNITSNDKTEFATLLSLGRRIAALTKVPLEARGAVEFLSPVNRRMLGQVARVDSNAVQLDCPAATPGA